MRSRVVQANVKRAAAEARKLGIRVSFLKHEEECSSRCWTVTDQSVEVGTRDVLPWWVLMCLAHEVGHCLSVRRGPLTTMQDYMRYRLGIPLSRKQGDGILAEELRAWRLGYAFLREHGLPITPLMAHARRVLHRTHIRRLGRA